MQNSLGHPVGSPSHLQYVGSARPFRRLLGRLLTVTGLAVAFFLAPTLQGINLVADQSAGATESTRTADEVAAAEVLDLLANS